MPNKRKIADVSENDEKEGGITAGKRWGKGSGKAQPKGEGKRGAKSRYPEKIQPYLSDIAKYTRCGVTEQQLCQYYGVGRTQWAEYKRKYPELSETLSKARQEFKTKLVNRSYEVAMGYSYEESTSIEIKTDDGQVLGVKKTTYTKYAKADAGMLQFLLINRFPDEFARDPQAIELRKKALELAEQGKLNGEDVEKI